MAFENQDSFQSPYQVHEYVKIKIGHTTMLKCKDDIFHIPKKTDFLSMDQTEFEKYYGRARDFVAQWLGMENRVIANEIANYF